MYIRTQAINNFFSKKTNMFKCLKCDKEFNFDSELTRHKNRKRPCDKQKDDKCLDGIMEKLNTIKTGGGRKQK